MSTERERYDLGQPAWVDEPLRFRDLDDVTEVGTALVGAVRETMVHISTVLVPMFEQIKRAAIAIDPKAAARARQGHPVFPRKQLIHKGRKP